MNEIQAQCTEGRNTVDILCEVLRFDIRCATEQTPRLVILLQIDMIEAPVRNCYTTMVLHVSQKLSCIS